MKVTKKESPPVPPEHQLSSRERQIMDIVYGAGPVTVAQVREGLPDAPGYSAVRAMMRTLETKGHLRHEDDGTRYVYLSVRPRGQAATSTLQKVVQTFFGGSIERTVATLLSSAETQLSAEELERISQLVEAAKKDGR
ncbi:MAG: BlaI/MecI/CopY family transcriptional regulator [Proteobacteria bacterium]|nr:MAG: BlaI/MecI/CopY family transcriptional regulator [Pseudomonadota bacterium]